MKYAFSPAGLAELETLRGEPTLFAFDFDGTLAPIVPDPDLASVRPGTRRLLERLAAAAPVAAVSGRRVRQLRAFVPPGFRAWAGDHGAEILPPRFQRFRGITAARARVRKWDRVLARSLPDLPGVWVERKDLSLAIHYRHSPRPAEARRAIFRAVSALDPGPRILTGKCVVNLLVPGLPHKGDAVRALMEGLGVGHALYVGDDANDEDVFALADPRIRTLRVGRHAGSHAALYLRNQSEIDRLLRFLLSLQRPRAPRYRERREGTQEVSEQENERTHARAGKNGRRQARASQAMDRARPGRHEDRRRDGKGRRTHARGAEGAYTARRLA